jgi:hypothetical protein
MEAGGPQAPLPPFITLGGGAQGRGLRIYKSNSTPKRKGAGGFGGTAAPPFMPGFFHLMFCYALETFILLITSIRSDGRAV